jgi:hypothetical protein
MSARKTITVSRDLDLYEVPDSWGDLLRDIAEFETQRVADGVDSADVGIYGSSNDYGSDRGIVSVAYSFERPETDDEYHDRMYREANNERLFQARKEAKVADDKAKRAAMYQLLKEEFGGADE